MLDFSIQLSDHQAAIAWNTSVILAALICFLFHWREGRRNGFDHLTWLTLIVLFYATILIGQRLGAFSSLDWSQLFSGEHQTIHSKKSILGAGLLAFPVFIFFKKYLKLSNKIFDVLFLGFPLALALARAGCLLAGCCFGTICDHPLGITYGAGMPAYEWQLTSGLINENTTSSLPVFPIQFYVFISNILIFYFLWKKRNAYPKAGALALLAISLLFINRFGIEFFRETYAGKGLLSEAIFGLKYGQWLCLLIAGISFFFFNKIKNIAPKKNFNNPIKIPFPTQTFILLSISACAFIFRSVLTFEEKIILILICGTALAVYANNLRLAHLNKKSIYAPAIYLSASSLLLISVPIDTLPHFPKIQRDTRWIELGTGGTFGSYSDINRDCDGDILSHEKIKNQSINFDASYNLGLKKGWAGFGIKGNWGSVSYPDLEPVRGYGFVTLGPYGYVNLKAVGIKFGVLYIDQYGNAITYPEKSQAIWQLRLGKLRSYHFDISLFEGAGVSGFPEPASSIGFFNYGFKDESGMKNLRVALSVINYESALSIGLKHPFGSTPLMFDGTVHFQKQLMVNLGLRYRFDMSWR